MVERERFRGEQRLQFYLWAHRMGLVSSASLFVFGMFGILWRRSGTYSCKVEDGKAIARELILEGETVGGRTGTCNSGACCDPDGRSGSPQNIGGSAWIGGICMLAGLCLFVAECLWKKAVPNDTPFYRLRISPKGILFLGAGAIALMTLATASAGVFSVAAGSAYAWAAWRREAGDNSLSGRRRRGDDVKACCNWREWLASDSIATTFWCFIYFLINAIMFLYTLFVWVDTVQTWESDLRDDDVKLEGCNECPDPSDKAYTRWRDECDLNKSLVKHGPLSYWAPIAKAAGVTLNFNCALLLVPVTKSVLIFLNEKSSDTYGAAQKRSAWFSSIFRSPLARYFPLSKNIEFHKLIATVTGILAVVHTVAHFFNYWQAPLFTQVRFAKWGWTGTAFLTGALALLAMFVIYTAANDEVKRAKFEIFWISHHFFALFYAALLLHGPVFYYWALIPIVLYLYERRARIVRGSRPFLVSRVEWIDPVLAVHFRPLDKAAFDFQEGTYVLLNCPFVSEHEWHPFTISSAKGDLVTGGRVSLETGQPVVAVDQTSTSRRYRPLVEYGDDDDHNARAEPSLLEVHETAYHDYVSVHIKVNSEDPGSWTHKLKEYFEMMAPARSYPFHLTRRDERGDVLLGRRVGPDSRQILRVDGPHAAPAVHYKHYGTVMVVGAGIGMTPCASILTAMLKYRWRLNFKPEILHFYWIVSRQDVQAFEWFVRLLAELEFELKKSRESGAVTNRNYCEINIFVTRAQKPTTAEDVASTTPPMRSPPPKLVNYNNDVEPTFCAEDLWQELMNPQTTSDRQFEDTTETNQFQDVYVWNGRPDWKSIFQNVKSQRQHRDIGCCFCGTAAIGADLAKMCKLHSSQQDDCIFTLHKENFS